MRKLFYLGSVVCCVLLACGKTERDEHTPDAPSAGGTTTGGSAAVGSAGQHAGAGQGSGGAAGAGEQGSAAATSDAGAGGAGPTEPESYGRCQGATYVDAPSGAACNPRHIIQWNGFAGPCHGPDVGSSCGTLSVVLSGEDGTLDGFECQTIDGIRTCDWIPADSESSRVDIDSDLLEALCAVTVDDPESVVYCMNAGS